MKLSDKMLKALVAQANMELGAGYLYRSIAAEAA